MKGWSKLGWTRQDRKIVAGRALTFKECFVRQSQCFQRLVEGVAKLANQACDYKKRQFYSIESVGRSAGFSRELLMTYGVHIGERGMLFGATLLLFFFFFFFFFFCSDGFRFS